MIRLAMLAGMLVIVSCGPPPFVVHVTFPGEVEVARGAPVIYEGVKVGHVESVALRQDVPTRPAQIALTLSIVDRALVLRADDRFHMATLRGVPIVRVEPSLESSEPLAPGATVAGVPPLVTRMEASLGEAIESIGAVVLEAAEAALEALEEAGGPIPVEPPEAEPDADGEGPAVDSL